MAVHYVSSQKELSFSFAKVGKGSIQVGPDEGVGFINELIGPMMIARDDVKVFVENGIEARLADKGVKVACKPEPRRCETIEETNVGGTADCMVGASLKHQRTRVSREKAGVETPEVM